ncbi:hypothetical protein EPA86_02100 [Litorilituus lipolyticus]|uniref:Succinylglutamate desuccinylase/Aspartoacylase catalytic domain-containing protein n=2 Tax=Litorilituus lipolyticus TaxID=2491017 RepID=A0A502L3M9_9GAMM|nr:hypothetical protein EPA86_02100 [Litorilituus lipolyticus]
MASVLVMKTFLRTTNYIQEPFNSDIHSNPLAFLRELNGLTIFDVKGIDETRTRVITTLIHGNEPSGFIALHQWLIAKVKPAVNIRFIVCNPEAAKLCPEFSHRYLYEAQDLNRYFDLSKDPKSCISLRAKQIIQAVREVNPEAIIDLHNTSGSSPAFGVSVSDNDKVLDLISLFTNKVILTGLHVGAIMEQDFSAPIVTIECGGATEQLSHQVAIAGVGKYTSNDCIFDHHADKVDIHRFPCRVELKPEIILGFGDYALLTADITVRTDIERLNQQLTPAGELIGWYNKGDNLPLIAKDEQGNDQLLQLLTLKNGCIYTKQSLQLFMATTKLDIANNDCLFYATIES